MKVRNAAFIAELCPTIRLENEGERSLGRSTFGPEPSDDGQRVSAR